MKTKKTKIEKIEFPPIPDYIMGKLRKDGKPDRRYTNGMYMLKEYMKQASGNYLNEKKGRV